MKHKGSSIMGHNFYKKRKRKKLFHNERHTSTQKINDVMMIHTYDALIITLSVQTAPPRFPRSGPGCPAEADVLPPSSHSVRLQRRSRLQRVYQRCRRHVNQERNRRHVNRRSRRYVNLRSRGHVNCNKVS